MQIQIRSEPFDPWQELVRHQNEETRPVVGFGATAVFVGTMRDYNEDETVLEMTLEHYPEMTERHLKAICETAHGRWELIDVLVVHRIGVVRPGDPIVLVAVWSSHRKQAFEASRFIMEDLKSKTPFWKKEELLHGKRWLEQNTPG
jgi:molybdopterin synthase catalytic subunit